ncbi:hypothetical protein Acor_84490 [Acrocarpospora corrugata]|uniref:Uncharacterized protein n=1 Tax=Acrocarpospora corrugata TaxID=35763 RepID=A0A5M3WDP4_9ACTN|nr:hypothetical protein [Acrocarpospora corrugata]GES06380.1 hypothetical protein Acor_84490 [Acrocarpospora corrugata]
MADEEIRAIEQLSDDLAGRVVIALAAENARTGAIRELTLDDLDLVNRRITLAGRRQRLRDLSYRVLRRWLRDRRATWPRTSNPHVLTSDKTAHDTSPISQFVTLRMNHLSWAAPADGTSIDRYHIYRYSDPRHLVSVATAQLTRLPHPCRLLRDDSPVRQPLCDRPLPGRSPVPRADVHAQRR